MFSSNLPETSKIYPEMCKAVFGILFEVILVVIYSDFVFVYYFLVKLPFVYCTPLFIV